MLPLPVARRTRLGSQLCERFHFLTAGNSLDSLQQLALRGTLWTVLGFGASQLLRFGGNVLLTRLLYPELFGISALANILLIALNLFSDLGLSVSIVRNEHAPEPHFVNTVWTLQVLRGTVLWLVSVALAVPFANFYGDARLQVLIPVVAFGALIGGFNSTSLFVLRREMNQRALTLLELGAQGLAMVVMLAWAWLSPGIWALVTNGVVYAAVKLVWSHRLQAGPRNRFGWDRAVLREVMQLGKWMLLASAILFFAEQIDRLTLGKLISLELLGVYGIALALADVPRQVTLAISSQVLFPAISRLRHLSHPALREKILRNRRAVLPVLAAGLALLACFGDVAIRTLYDARYCQAAWMLPLLAVGLWPRLLCSTIEPALLALGLPKYTAFGQLARFAFTLSGVLLGFAWFGIVGAIAAVALNDIAYYIILNLGLYRQGLSGLKQDFAATLALALFSALLLLGRALAGIPFHV